MVVVRTLLNAFRSVFILFLSSDRSDKSEEPLPPVSDRKFLEVDVDNQRGARGASALPPAPLRTLAEVHRPR
jgi:hypothetical protein